MKYNFYREVERSHKKEVQLFLAQQSVSAESYCKNAIEAGYEDLHSYESDITKGLIKRVFVFAIFLTLLIFLI